MAETTCGDHPDGVGYDPEPCLLCGRRRPVPDRVCGKCRQRGLDWIADLPALYRRLEVVLQPGAAVGERVRSSPPGSRTPVMLAALALRGTSTRMAQPDWRRPEGWTPEDADLSIPEWADGWVRAWRHRHRHHRPSLATAHPTDPPALPPPPARPDFYDPSGQLLPAPEVRELLHRWETELAAWQATRDEAAAEGGRVVLGLGAALPPADRPDDPLEQHLAHRYGQAAAGYKLGVDCGYLAAWFESACDDEHTHPDLPAFLAGLRSLVGAARAALGEADRGDWYCGRCPAMLKMRDEHDAEVVVPCGTDLWIDPSSSRIHCPCCRRTDVHRDQFLSLRGAMLEIWSEAELAWPRPRRSSLPRPPAAFDRPQVDFPRWVTDGAPDRQTWETAS